MVRPSQGLTWRDFRMHCNKVVPVGFDAICRCIAPRTFPAAVRRPPCLAASRRRMACPRPRRPLASLRRADGTRISPDRDAVAVDREIISLALRGGSGASRQSRFASFAGIEIFIALEEILRRVDGKAPLIQSDDAPATGPVASQPGGTLLRSVAEVRRPSFALYPYAREIYSPRRADTVHRP
jgi:hypothetical protein